MLKQKFAELFIGPMPSDEQRDSYRVKARMPLQAVLLDEPGNPIVLIMCRDTCSHGMGFFSQRAFRLNERFVVRFHFANDHDRLVLCRVRFCLIRAAQRYQGGVEFLDAVTAQAGSTEMPAHWAHKPILP